MRPWDVVVVGAGPAGCSAAVAAARAGRRVLLLEKATLPRYKTCGGGIVGASVRALPPGFELPVKDSVRTVAFTMNGRLTRVRRSREPIFQLVDRADLDAALARTAVAAGAVLRDGTAVQHIDEEPDGSLRLRLSGRAAAANGPHGSGDLGGPAGSAAQGGPGASGGSGGPGGSGEPGTSRGASGRGDLDGSGGRSGSAGLGGSGSWGDSSGPDDSNGLGDSSGLGGADGRGGAEVVRALAVVGADGSASRIAGYVGVRLYQVDLGLEWEIPVPPDVAAFWRGRVHLDWGPLPGSYGWVFPKGDSLTVGVICARGQGEPTRRYLRDFVARLGLAQFPPSISSGHLTRCRREGSPLSRGRVLLAGDAAGLLEPWTREGISYALRSGRLAGEAAARIADAYRDAALPAGVTSGSDATLWTDAAVRADTKLGADTRLEAGATRRAGADVRADAGLRAAIGDYQAAIDGMLGREMAAGRDLLAAFERRPVLFHGAVTLLPPVWGMFRDVVRGDTTFADVLLRRVPRRALNLAGRRWFAP